MVQHLMQERDANKSCNDINTQQICLILQNFWHIHFSSQNTQEIFDTNTQQFINDLYLKQQQKEEKENNIYEHHLPFQTFTLHWWGHPLRKPVRRKLTKTLPHSTSSPNTPVGSCEDEARVVVTVKYRCRCRTALHRRKTYQIHHHSTAPITGAGARAGQRHNDRRGTLP